MWAWNFVTHKGVRLIYVWTFWTEKSYFELGNGKPRRQLLSCMKITNFVITIQREGVADYDLM